MPGSFQVRLILLLGCIVSLIGWTPIHAQTDAGTIAGTVLNSWDGRPLSGVIVTVRGTVLAVTTDAQGRYQVEGVPIGEHTVRFSRSGFAAVSVGGVRVLPGLTSNLDGTMRPEFYEMEEYEVTAEDFQDQAIEILEQRQASVSFLDVIGAEQFKRLGATDAAQILAKLPGTTVVDGKFAVIRGLSDRYNITQLNGAQIPTADPYRQGAPLDIIPATMIQEVSVSKTFTPNLPGGFAGGLANLVTKSFPDRFYFQVDIGLEYNSQATFNDNFLSYPGSPTDWAGFGKSTRALPSNLEGKTGADFRRPPPAPRNETPAQAAARRNQADALQGALQSFPDYTFSGTPETPPPNYGGTFSIGETLDLNGHDFGYFVSGVYRNRWMFYDDGIRARYRPTGVGTIEPYQYFSDTRAVNEATWASVVNLAYELVPEDHTISFTFYWNQNGEDTTRRQVGTVENVEQVVELNMLQWIQRQIHTFQIRGDDHFEDFLDWRTDWLVSLSNTTQDEPDLRYFHYARQPDGSDPFFSNSIPEPIFPTRFYRDINEDAKWASLNNRIPFEQWSGLESFIRFGGGFNSSVRQFREQTFQFGGAGAWPSPSTPNDYLTPENLQYTTTVSTRGTNYVFQRWFQEGISPAFYSGRQQIPAGYTMLELPVVERFKITGGARLENTFMSIQGDGGAAGSTNSVIDQLDVMPAISGTYQIITNMNLRASFSQTVARPSYRELAPYRSYDTAGDEIVQGNPGLQMTSIDNYDVRWEWFPQPGAVIAVSGFYKYLQNPIEKVALTFGGGIVTYENRTDADLYGIELEANTKLGFLDDAMEEFSVGFNFAYIESAVELTPTELANEQVLFPDVPRTRTLFDQSPWIVNFDLTYDHKASGTTATVSLGAAGPYIFIVDRAGPDVYEHPPMQLNFVVTQRLSEHWKMRFSARNLLNPDLLRTYGDDKDGAVYAKFSMGVLLGVTLTYEY